MGKRQGDVKRQCVRLPERPTPLRTQKDSGRPSSTESWLVRMRPLGLLGSLRPMRSPIMPPAAHKEPRLPL
jgi:hypothetical protein